MNVLLIPALAEHAEAIFPMMAEEERDLLVGGPSLAAIVRTSPLSWCALHDGVPMCLGGVQASGLAWMVSTPELHRQKRFFLSQSRTVMAAITARFDAVSVVVDTCYFRSVRWLFWLGFRAEGGLTELRLTSQAVMVQRFQWRRP